MKRFLLILFSMLCVLSLVMGTTSCQPSDEPDDSVTMIDIVKNGVTNYRIVRNDNAVGDDAGRVSAMKLGQAIEAATGCDIELTTDWTPDEDGTAFEILVGDTARPINDQVPDDLAKDEFVILFIGNKILINGGSEHAIIAGVDYFIEKYLGYNSENDSYANTDLAIPEALNLRQTFDFPQGVYIIHDIKSLGGGGNNEDYNDIVRFYTSLQGRLNKDAKKNGFFVYQMYDSTDKFWLDYISGEGRLLENCIKTELKNWKSLWDALGSYIQQAGIVVWDPEVPATANVAATICSVEGYLPVRYDEDENSLYTWLINHEIGRAHV